MKATLILVALLLLGSACSGPSQASVSPAAGNQPSSAAPSPSPAALVTATPTSLEQIVNSPVYQHVFRCPTIDELEWVDSIQTLTFTSDPSAGALVCTASQGSRDLTTLQERAYQAVLLMKWIRFDSPLPWTYKTLEDWLANAIHGIEFRDDAENSYCCKAGGVIVVQTKNLGVLMAGARLQTWEATLSLAALFVHEARHNEGYGHTCGTNDQTVTELGSWGVQYYFYLWVGTHSDPSVVTEPYRTAAARTAAGMARFFCQPAPELSPASSG